MKRLTPIFLIGSLVVVLAIAFLLSKNKIAQSFRENGLLLYDSLKFEEAASMFSKSIKWSPNTVTSINLAKTLYNLEKYKATDSLCQIIINNDSTLAEAYATWGQALVKLNNADLAIEQLNKALEIDSGLYYALYYRGIAYASLGKYDLALNDYEIAKQKMTDNTDIYLSSITAKTRLEDFSGAIADYTHLIASNTENSDAFYMRGYLRYKTSDYKGAITDFTQAIALSDTISRAYYYRGLAEAMSGSFHEAINDFYLSGEKGFKPDASIYNAGKAHYELGQFTDANIALTELTTKYKNSEYTLNSFELLGAIALSKSDFKQAQQYFTKAIQTDSSYAKAFYLRAIALENLKSFSKAVEDLNRCIKLGMNDADIYFARGVQYINLYQYDDGCADFRAASTMGHAQAQKFTNMYCQNRK